MNAPELTPRLRAGGYIRVSAERGRSDDPESYRSIPLQRKRVEGIAASDLLDVVEWYIDEDWSGDREDRPDYNRMMRDARAGAIDVVICATLDRFGRKAGQVITDVEDLQDLGRRVIFGTPRIDTMDDIAGPIVLGLFASLAAMQQRQIAASWRAVVDERIAELAPLAVPYGYVRRGPNDLGLHSGTLVPDEELPAEGQPSPADVVRRIFEWRASEWGWSTIVTALNEAGVWTPTQLYAHRATKQRKRTPSSKWSHSAVWNLVRSEAYLGIFVFVRKDRAGNIVESHRIEDAWPALVSQDEYDDAQKATTKAVARNGSTAGALLKGLVRCASCASTMRPGNNRDRGGKYECAAWRRGCPACATIQREGIDAYVIEQVRELASEDPDTLAAAEANDAIATATAELAQLRAARRAFMRGYGDALASGDEDAQDTRDWHDERVTAKQRELERLEAHAQLHDSRTTDIEVLESGSIDERRMLLGDVIDAVFVAPSGRNVRVPAEERVAIAWSGQAPRRLLSGSGRNVALRAVDLDFIRSGGVLADD